MTAEQSQSSELPIFDQSFLLAELIIGQESPAISNNGLGNKVWTLLSDASPLGIGLRLETDYQTHATGHELGMVRYINTTDEESLQVRKASPIDLEHDAYAAEMLALFQESWQIHSHAVCLAGLRQIATTRLGRPRLPSTISGSFKLTNKRKVLI